jgi:Glycosyltransferase
MWYYCFSGKKSGSKKIIAHSHADLKFRGSFLSRNFGKLELFFQKILISRYATDFWGCSQEANNSLFYKWLQTIENCAIIKNAVDVKSFQQVSGIKISKLLKFYKAKENTIILGNVGRIVRHKNIAFVLEVLNKLEKRNIDFRFVIAGRSDDEAYMEEMLEKAKKYAIEDKVIYLGERDDIQTVVNTFDVFVGPALKEGFGLVAVEAQAAGIPCVLYTGFPKSVDMQLNLTTFIENFEVQKWVNSILEIKERKCMDKDLIKNKIETLGYDIIGNTKNIEKLYVK